MGKTAKMNALQMEWEVIWIKRSLFQRYRAPQKAPAMRAARIKIGLPEKTWTPAYNAVTSKYPWQGPTLLIN
jgi:hypothetical protein